MLGEYAGEKGDDFGFGIATSPNQQLLAGVFVARRKLQGTNVKVGLYSRELEEYWTMPTSCTKFNNVYVTDDGDVLLVTKHYRIERADVEDDIQMLIEAEQKFVEYLVRDERPPLILPNV